MADIYVVFTPADDMESAAALVEKRMEGVTPPPWWRPMNVRNKAVVFGFLPEEETGRYRSGFDYDGKRERVAVVQVNTWSDGAHTRPGYNGRDLEWAALMHPGSGPFLMALLLRAAKAFREDVAWDRPDCGEGCSGHDLDMYHKVCGGFISDDPEGCSCFAIEIGLARFLLEPRNIRPEYQTKGED